MPASTDSMCLRRLSLCVHSVTSFQASSRCMGFPFMNRTGSKARPQWGGLYHDRKCSKDEGCGMKGKERMKDEETRPLEAVGSLERYRPCEMELETQRSPAVELRRNTRQIPKANPTSIDTGCPVTVIGVVLRVWP